ncbi:hypothetical protein V502_10855 [Pseudogymnoascus sp. VKM F-4520 (FW-2644)]|nr:hypothetical protein V502_10855 [Pseudogymnoascus sp. VKM F-4520 (FW-2644)]
MTSSSTAPIKRIVRMPPASGLTDLKPVPIYDVTKFPDERTQTLQRLLQRGHTTVAPLRDPKLILHSHLPHVWLPFSHPLFTVAYVDFFDEEVKARHGDWGKVLEEYLYSGPNPLINGYTGGLGHPFIHLAYAYEFRSQEVATQALSQGCTEYNPLHHLLDHALHDNSTYKSTSLPEVIERVRADDRFGLLFGEPGIMNMDVLLEKSHLEVVLEHWNAWEVVDPVRQLEQCCDLAVLIALSNGNPEASFDFYNAHIMTVAHALRVLWHYFPPQRQVSILRQFALFAILNYVSQLRPAFGMEGIETVKVDGRDWGWVVDTALKHKWALDVHFFKVVRAPRVFEESYGRKDDFYLMAAIKYVTEFQGWEGYGKGVEGFVPSRDGYISN